MNFTLENRRAYVADVVSAIAERNVQMGLPVGSIELTAAAKRAYEVVSALDILGDSPRANLAAANLHKIMVIESAMRLAWDTDRTVATALCLADAVLSIVST